MTLRAAAAAAICLLTYPAWAAEITWQGTTITFTGAFAILRPAQAHRMTGHDYRSAPHWCNWSAASACTRWRARGGKFICPPGVESVGCQDQRRRERTRV
jgi:hypothetical protein